MINFGKSFSLSSIPTATTVDQCLNREVLISITTFSNKILDTGCSIRTFMEGINLKMRLELLFSQLKPKFDLNDQPRFFNQGLCQLFYTCKTLIDCSFLRMDLPNELIRGNCQGLRNCMNCLEKQTGFFWGNLLDFCYHALIEQTSICRLSFSFEFSWKWHCLKVTDKAKSWERSDFSWKTNLFSSKISRCLSFFKVSPNFFITCKYIGEGQLLRLILGNANLVCGKCL